MTGTAARWRQQAIEAFDAMVCGDEFEATASVLDMLRDGPPTIVIGACLAWVDQLFSLEKPPAHGFQIPEAAEAAAQGLGDAHLWAMQLVAARANDDAVTAKELFAQLGQAREVDFLTDRMLAVLTFAAVTVRALDAGTPKDHGR